MLNARLCDAGLSYRAAKKFGLVLRRDYWRLKIRGGMGCAL